MEDYPSELRVKPVPVIAVAGHSKIQDRIADGLSKTNFKVLKYELTDPIAISSPKKRISYDDYTPKVRITVHSNVLLISILIITLVSIFRAF
jgi:hypothetical protein